MQPTAAQLQAFQQRVWAYYRANGRTSLPWRQPLPEGRYDPYRIMVSELMLQQTQVVRVIPKYEAFLTKFPTAAELAAAPLSQVLTAWQGLGYNRRAKYLHQAASAVMNEGFAHTIDGLQALPGVGRNTAGAIVAYAYDVPVVFIETNIRSVFLHHFFADRTDVPDREVGEVVAAALPAENFREWYWALMDYGAHLKQTVGNTARASRTYRKQSTFKGSRRAVRGAVLRRLASKPADLPELTAAVDDDRLGGVLDDLAREGLIVSRAGRYHLYD